MTTEWDEIALPALRQIHAWEDEENAFEYDTNDVAKALGIEDVNGVGRQLEALEEAGLITKGNAISSGNPHNYFSLRVTAEGRRVVGEWPSDPATALLKAIEHAIEHHLGGPDEKRLKKLRRLLRKMSPEALRAIAQSLLIAAL
ncbi:hypothetical protein [Candidatus Poriferisodalis sp.]|uniref:hypothetical protein n=1 Tax=Candidatus Poriferisodalis sp. TaxID=3101277 RepID=UPI003B52F341